MDQNRKTGSYERGRAVAGEKCRGRYGEEYEKREDKGGKKWGVEE
jgi:hypothetical protein